MKPLNSYLPSLPRVVKRKKRKGQLSLLPRKIDWELVKKGLCGICGTKLRWDKMSDKIRCRSKKSRDDFFITQETWEDILSGKRLEEYKQLRASQLK